MYTINFLVSLTFYFSFNITHPQLVLDGFDIRSEGKFRPMVEEQLALCSNLAKNKLRSNFRNDLSKIIIFITTLKTIN